MTQLSSPEYELTLAVTGHRPSKLGNAYDIQHPTNMKIARIMRAFILEKAGFDEDSRTFSTNGKVLLISGMALGVDTLWALVGLKLKFQFPGKFELECAIPCANHSSRWKKSDQERHADIIKRSGIVTFVSKEPYAPYLMQKRNEYMVDKADELLAVWDGTSSGTRNCVKYAEKKGSIIYRYHPELQPEIIRFDEKGK